MLLTWVLPSWMDITTACSSLISFHRAPWYVERTLTLKVRLVWWRWATAIYMVGWCQIEHSQFTVTHSCSLSPSGSCEMDRRLSVLSIWAAFLRMDVDELAFMFGELLDDIPWSAPSLTFDSGLFRDRLDWDLWKESDYCQCQPCCGVFRYQQVDAAVAYLGHLGLADMT